MNEMLKVWERIGELTKVDIAKMKSKEDPRFVLLASLYEEVGELGTALKVENGIVHHKTLDEPAWSEASDVLVCGIMMYFANGGEMVKTLKEPPPPMVMPVFQTLAILNVCVGNAASQLLELKAEPHSSFSDHFNNDIMAVIRIAQELYVELGGPEGQLCQTIHKKLDKWEKNQNRFK